VVLVEWKKKFWTPKNTERTQIKSRGPVLWATAGVALISPSKGEKIHISFSKEPINFKCN